MKQISVHIRGLQPLLCHSDRGSDPLDPLKREQARFTGKRKKTEDDHQEIGRLDWLLGLYTRGDKPVMPTWNIFACIRDGAKLTKRGKDVTRAVLFDSESTPILYDGPSNIDDLYADKRFVHRCSVGNQKARVIRTRPMFPEWELKFDFLFDESVFNQEDILGILESAGRYIGLGDFRPRFGRFEIVSAK